MNYVYILQCCDGSFYTGWTNNLENRINAHNSGKGAKYTKSRLPVKLVYFESFTLDDISESPDEISPSQQKIALKKLAMSREYAIKKMSRIKKEQLIKGFKGSL